MSTVELHDIRKSYGTVEVIKSVSLSIEKGEFISLLGPSGCGKTTLLRMIAGLETVSKGEITIGGRDATRLPPEKRNIAMVFQSYALLPHLSVLGNVLFPLEMRRIGTPASRREKAEAVLEMVGLAHLGTRYPRQLSGGQQQRVALARAVVCDPEVLLLDEPLSNLDAAMRERMQEELIELHRKTGLTTVFVTHDQEEALSMSDRVVLLNGGRIEQMATPSELYARPATSFAASFIGATNLVEGRAHAGVVELDGGARLRLPDGALNGGVSLSLRQEDLILSPPDIATGISGKVINRIYLGARMRYVVATSSGEIRVLADCDTGFDIGDRVCITIAPEKIVVLQGAALTG